MKQYYLFTVFLLISILAACGGQAEVGQVAPEAVDPAHLPETVDVTTTAALQERDDVLLIDVREQWEYDEGHIPGVTHIPLDQIPDRLTEIPADKTVILTCRSGNRSGQATNFLKQNGFENVHNMEGGILAWQSAGYEVEQ